MLKFLIIQENSRHKENVVWRECYCYQRALRNLNQFCDMWGLGHANYETPPDFNTYDVILNFENYDSGWVPDLSSYTNPLKMLWAIDGHCKGMQSYQNEYQRGKYNYILQSTKDYVDDHSVWFPNAFDDTLVFPKTTTKRADVGFIGHLNNRGPALQFLHQRLKPLNYTVLFDEGKYGDDMVNAVNSYKIQFNLNIANDINSRSFETIACRIPLVTNYNPQYEELGFVDGENCMMYRSGDELFQKVLFLLQNEGKRNEMAEKGYQLSKRHTIQKRCEHLLKFIKNVQPNLPLNFEKIHIQKPMIHIAKSIKPVAVCISGQVRTLDKCFPSIRDNILSKLDCDVFAYIPDDDQAGQIDLVSPKKVIREKDRPLPEYDFANRTQGRYIINVQKILQQMYGQMRVNQMKYEQEQLNGRKYDWVVRLRPDMIFYNDIEDFSKCDPNAVYLGTSAHDFEGGYNDRFAFGNSRNMSAYLNRYKLFEEKDTYPWIFHPELILKYTLDVAQIPIQRSQILYKMWRIDGRICDW